MGAPPEALTAYVPWRRRYGRVAAAAVVCLVGLVLTGFITWAARDNYLSTEHRLLVLQAKQANQVLMSATASTGVPLQELVQAATLTRGSAAAFVEQSSKEVGAGPHGYADMSLWLSTGGSFRDVVTTGLHPQLAAGSPLAGRLVDASRAHATFAVYVHYGSPRRLGYVYATHGSPYVVYAEQRLPKPGHTTLKQNQAFSDLSFAIYLGRTAQPQALLVSAGSRTPIRDGVVQRSRFGTTYLTLVATPDGALAGTLPRDLPWLFGAVGVFLTLLAAFAAQLLVRHRQLAEADAARSRGLAREISELYQEQRTIVGAFQRSLLPVRNPPVEGMQAASRYVAGARGVEIGGDWYSLLALDGSRYGFVVGDVSGRGLLAATVMAALRYTTRTLLLEGYEPARVLERCALDVGEQLRGHFATVIVGLGDVSRHELTLANAGHLPPLLLQGDSGSFVQLPAATPIGVAPDDYESITIATPPGSTLVAYTDGLVERRHEHLDVGLQRLANSAARWSGDLETMVDEVITELTGNSAEDDIAILALRFA